MTWKVFLRKMSREPHHIFGICGRLWIHFCAVYIVSIFVCYLLYNVSCTSYPKNHFLCGVIGLLPALLPLSDLTSSQSFISLVWEVENNNSHGSDGKSIAVLSFLFSFFQHIFCVAYDFRNLWTHPPTFLNWCWIVVVCRNIDMYRQRGWITSYRHNLSHISFPFWFAVSLSLLGPVSVTVLKDFSQNIILLRIYHILLFAAQAKFEISL